MNENGFTFLSRLFGGEARNSPVAPKPTFLSRLFGGEVQTAAKKAFGPFLSRLFGGEGSIPPHPF